MWIAYASITLGLWGAHTIFANKANIVHGPRVTIWFEAVAFLGIAFIAATRTTEWSHVTIRSAVYAALMAALSAGGFYSLLLASRSAPDKILEITLITAMYPLITVLVVTVVRHFSVKLVAEVTPMRPIQVLGLLMSVSGLALVLKPYR
jgi:drug/metabolite transporter (DMT)-like permease